MKRLSIFLAVSMILLTAGVPGLWASRRIVIDSFPWENVSGEKVPSYLYLEGGFLTTDKGCPDWGTTDPSKALFLGDHLGDVVVTYSSGKVEKVPLVLGYTVWMHGIWMEGPAPFKGDAADKDLAALLERTLCLSGGFEGKEKGILRIELSREDIKSISIEKGTASLTKTRIHIKHLIYFGIFLKNVLTRKHMAMSMVAEILIFRISVKIPVILALLVIVDHLLYLINLFL